jgi:hypothetical protein
MVLIGGWVIARMARSLEIEDRVEARELANLHVADEVARARAQLASHKWAQAISVLKGALATEDATDFDTAWTLLSQAQRGQGMAVVAAAQTAVRHKKLARATQLLQGYLGQAQAPCQAEAAQLLGEIDLATSTPKALALLQKLPETTWASYGATGNLADIDRVSNPGLRAVYRQTLRSSLAQAREMRAARRAAEQQARQLRAQQQREEYERRIAFVRRTPVCREVQDFIADTRREERAHRAALAAFDQQMLEASAVLLRGVNVAAQDRQALTQKIEKLKQEQDAEQKRLRTWQQSMADRMSTFRANVKERFRFSQGCGPAEAALFDRFVDGELEHLLKEIETSSGEDLGQDL